MTDLQAIIGIVCILSGGVFAIALLKYSFQELADKTFK